MSFRAKLLAFFTLTIIAAVSLVAWGVSVYSRRAFEQFDRQRTDALVAQFHREYAQRGDEIVHRMQGIADAEATLRMAMDLNRPQADASQYYNDARGIAQAQQLDFLDIVSDDGTLISSSEWPARFGYKNDWVSSEPDWNAKGAFLQRVDMPDAVDLGLLVVRTVSVGEKHLFLIGGQRLDQNFLATLVLPEGVRALLYRNLESGFVPTALTDVNGQVGQADLFSPLITEVQTTRHELQRTIDSSSSDSRASSESFNAIPLLGREGDLLGVLLVGSSRQELVEMLNFIRALALIVGGGVILLGLILGWWISARVTRPIEKLAAGAREVTAGRWEARVEVHSRDEIGQLAAAFNEMTRQLAEQRERLVQTERVAAWRELARRLAHELKNPLFPLQLTVENLQRAREQSSEQFDEVFFESTATLRAELENLKAIVSRFSDFAKMPSPEFEFVDVNESVRSVIKLFEPQLSAVGRPAIVPELYLDEKLPRAQADPILLRRALENLVLNSLDAMPAGGTLTVRTSRQGKSKNKGTVRLEVSDTGAGLTREECAHLFTPYYTSKRHGTGLGLAIVQSVVSDHGGTIAVESAPGAGATFRIELPIRQANQPANDRELEWRSAFDTEPRNEARRELPREQRAGQSIEPIVEHSVEDLITEHSDSRPSDFPAIQPGAQSNDERQERHIALRFDQGDSLGDPQPEARVEEQGKENEIDPVAEATPEATSEAPSEALPETPLEASHPPEPEPPLEAMIDQWSGQDASHPDEKDCNQSDARESHTGAVQNNGRSSDQNDDQKKGQADDRVDVQNNDEQDEQPETKHPGEKRPDRPIFSYK